MQATVVELTRVVVGACLLQLVRTFGRRMMTDKVIQCFALLNLIALLVLIIYVSVSKKSLTSSSNDNGPNRRLLRGFDGTEEEW
jgi:hypothetical protein